MDITKFDKKLLDSDDHPTRIAWVHLSTQFDEDIGKNPTKFKSGGVVFEDEAGKHQDTPDVFDKVAEALSDLTPATKI